MVNSYPFNVNFWAVVLHIHTSLLIPGIGSHIVNWSTVLFVVLSVSGLILWYPKQKKHLRQRITIKWNASPKRLNYDLHNVLGFYISLLALVIALTGLFMAFDWVKNSVYWLATGGQSPVAKQVKIKSALPDQLTDSENKVEEALIGIISKYDKINNYNLEYAIDSTAVHRLTVNTAKGYFYNRNDVYAVDQYTGEILKSDLWEDKNNGERLEAANLNIHIGLILGLPGKILAFIASLVSASLPVTGFILWLGRRKKKKSGRDSPVRPDAAFALSGNRVKLSGSGARRGAK